MPFSVPEGLHLGVAKTTRGCLGLLRGGAMLLISRSEGRRLPLASTPTFTSVLASAEFVHGPRGVQQLIDPDKISDNDTRKFNLSVYIPLHLVAGIPKRHEYQETDRIGARIRTPILRSYRCPRDYKRSAMLPERNDSASMICYPQVSNTEFPSTASQSENLIGRAFQLAYFLVQDRTAAIEIVCQARRRLRAEQSREKKRTYWRRSLRQKIRRMTRDEGDALQWLIYLQAEKFERNQEEFGCPSTRDLRVRYIKCIMQMTGNVSSFYVAVGLYRILHSYTTPEVQNLYEWLTEDFTGAEKYRRVKRALMQKLAARFGDLITIRQAENQELRFAVCEQQNDYAELVTDCLEMFTPWSTRNACPPATVPDSLPGNILRAAKSPARQLHVDVEEVRNCHLLIHPPCFDQLGRRLGMVPCYMRLAMPQFRTETNRNNDDSAGPAIARLPSLTDEERDKIARVFETSHSERQRTAPASVSILADGVKCGQFDLIHHSVEQYRIAEGTRLIEFCAEREKEFEVLAAHYLEYTDRDGIAAGEHIVDIAKNIKLTFATLPADSESDQAGGATVSVSIALSPRFMWNELFQPFGLPRLPGYVAVAVVIFLAWWWPVRHYHEVIQRQQAVIAKAEADRRSAEAAAASLRSQLAGATSEIYRLSPDSFNVRGPENTPTPLLQLARHASLLQLALPVESRDGKTSYRATLKLFSNKSEILREDLLQVTQGARGPVVVLTLPLVGLADGNRYVITLESTQAGRSTRIGDYSFYLKRP